MQARRAVWLGAAWLATSGAFLWGCDAVFGIGSPTLIHGGAGGGTSGGDAGPDGSTGGSRTTTTTSTSTTTTASTTTDEGCDAGCTASTCDSPYCDAGTCVHQPVNNGNPCGAQQECVADLCIGGSCSPVELAKSCGDGGMCSGGTCMTSSASSSSSSGAIGLGGTCTTSAQCANLLCCCKSGTTCAVAALCLAGCR
jgi:hypothetical protein